MNTLTLFCKIFFKRWQQNKIAISAGYLTYSTMLAIVPLIMVVFSVFTFFPIFHEATELLKDFIYDNFAPNAGHMVEEYIELFVSNSKKMGLISIIGLFVVAVMLISSIDQSLNDIWHNTRKRSIFISFLLYTLILIFAPIFAGMSIAISTYVMSFDVFSENGMLSFSHHLLKYVPFCLIWLLFTLVYKIVPNTEVKGKHATIGALFAAIFFTLGKQAFIWYVTTFPSYQAIYGALAVLPIMIVWIHLSWQVVLLGGQFASVLKDLEMIKNGELELK
ncbi:virulence factor BrkB family protein [Actinobacillus equuli subsp. haemolyticus]|uniref:virulence factor BrkB family protein n=1 Tax=Actinobacillus equuli TaxID=718 RepID=UPI0024419620|nr:virulence factor BrkB family protein [Actinobacillus equuli]WGE80737.1 virulence factor BrkB family protein [Actinobacillus equuli subsp. haemolyticus]